MIRTPQHYKRENVKTIFKKVLQDNAVVLVPEEITVKEKINPGPMETVIDFSFFDGDQHVLINTITGHGLMHCLFSGLRDNYIEEYHSISNLKLIDLAVTPIMSKNRESLGADAKVSLCLRVDVQGHGSSEFVKCSRSIIDCSFQGILEVFQFYLNCHKTFVKLRQVIKEAESRNRTDIVQACLSDLSILTEVNFYNEKDKKI